MRRGAAAIALVALVAAAGCAAIMGIEEGRLVAAKDDAGGAVDGSVDAPSEASSEAAAPDGAILDAGCDASTVTITSVEDTFLVDEDGGAYGSQATVDIGQGGSAVGLFRFDFGASVGASVKAGRAQATLVLRVDDSVNFGQPGAAQVYPIRDSWLELEATWRLATAGAHWQTPGARGAQDRGDSVGGGLVPSAAKGAEIRIPLDRLDAGAAWVANDRLSLLVEPSGSLRAVVVAHENPEAGAPRLEVRYCP